MDLRKKILLVLCLIAIPVCSNAALECLRYRKAMHLRELGHEFDHAGRVREAIGCYEESVRLYPYFIDLHQELAELYEAQHDFANAERCLSAAIQNKPSDPISEAVLYRMRGNFYFHQGKLDLAESDLAHAFAKDPTDGLAEKLLAACRKKISLRAPVDSTTVH